MIYEPVLLLVLAAMGAAEVQPTPLPIGLRLDDVQGLEADEARELGEALREGIELITGRRTFLDDGGGVRCARDTACIADVRSRTGSSDVVLVQLIAAGTRLRVVAERAGAGGLVSQRLQADVQREREALRGVGQILFPESRSSRAIAEVAPAPVATAAPAAELGPWIARGSIGAGAIAAGFAIALRLSSNGARDRAALPGADLEAERSASDAHGLASNVLFGGAAALITGGVVYLLTERAAPSDR